MVSKKFELLLVLVNQGYSEIVMNAARNEGARGGTILNARGSADSELEKKFGVVITPDKEMIMIVVASKTRDAIMNAINKAAGIETKGMGIIFSLPIDNVAGLKFE